MAKHLDVTITDDSLAIERKQAQIDDFRHIKSDDLDPRPVFHRLKKGVKGHVLICMLAAYLTWHLCQAWEPLTYIDEDPPAQANPVAPARRSASAEVKASRQHDTNGRPYRSFGGLLAHLGTLTRNQLQFAGAPAEIPVLTEPTSQQRQASTSSASRSRSPCGSSQDRHRQDQRNSRSAAVSVSEAAVTSD
jgi:hypothetical protein